MDEQTAPAAPLAPSPLADLEAFMNDLGDSYPVLGFAFAREQPGEPDERDTELDPMILAGLVSP